MLAPTLAVCGVSEDLVWRISSAIMLVVLVPWLAFYGRRRKAAAPEENLPLRYWVMTILGTVTVVALALNVAGSPFHPGPAALAITIVYVLSFASVAFLATYSLFLRD
jgi:hydrogenase-4 membrane subunit HyfE